MGSSVFNSREFDEDVAKAKRATANGPVFITDRGKPQYVLLSIEEYRRLESMHPSVAQVLGNADAAVVELELEERNAVPSRPLDLARALDPD